MDRRASYWHDRRCRGMDPETRTSTEARPGAPLRVRVTRRPRFPKRGTAGYRVVAGWQSIRIRLDRRVVSALDGHRRYQTRSGTRDTASKPILLTRWRMGWFFFLRARRAQTQENSA